jgi:hypothetical protein
VTSLHETEGGACMDRYLESPEPVRERLLSGERHVGKKTVKERQRWLGAWQENWNKSSSVR